MEDDIKKILLNIEKQNELQQEKIEHLLEIARQTQASILTKETPGQGEKPDECPD